MKTYMVRKPSDLEDVLVLTKKYGYLSEEVRIVEKIKLTPEQYEDVCNNPLNDYPFLEGKGGYEDNMHCVIELSCGRKKKLYVDPSGTSYCRYMGVAC